MASAVIRLKIYSGAFTDALKCIPVMTTAGTPMDAT